MSLEEALKANTEALQANTAALKAGGGGKASGGGASAGKYTKDQMSAALNDVKEKHGTPAAKAIIKSVGGVDKIAEITDPAVIDKVYAAAKAKHEEAAGSNDEM
jgi:hypothetical protein